MIFCNFMFAIAWKTFLLLWDWDSQCCKQKRSKLTCKFKSIRKRKYIWHVLFCSAWRCILAWRISAPFALTSMGTSWTGRVCPGRTSIGCTSPLKVIRACDPVPSCWIKFQLRKPELHIRVAYKLYDFHPHPHVVLFYIPKMMVFSPNRFTCRVLS